MIKKQIIWSKTVLSAYRRLGTLCGSIDKTIDQLAKNSFYECGIWNESNSILNISKRILELSNKKIDYINLKVIVEKVLRAIPEKYAKALILKNIKGLEAKTVSKLLQISERSLYRRINIGLEEFANKMKNFGYTFEKLEVIYFADKYISSIYNSYMSIATKKAEEIEDSVASALIDRDFCGLEVQFS